MRRDSDPAVIAAYVCIAVAAVALLVLGLILYFALRHAT